MLLPYALIPPFAYLTKVISRLKFPYKHLHIDLVLKTSIRDLFKGGCTSSKLLSKKGAWSPLIYITESGGLKS